MTSGFIDEISTNFHIRQNFGDWQFLDILDIVICKQACEICQYLICQNTFTQFCQSSLLLIFRLIQYIRDYSGLAVEYGEYFFDY